METSFKPFQSSVAFHIEEIYYLILTANQITGFYMKWVFLAFHIETFNLVFTANQIIGFHIKWAKVG